MRCEECDFPLPDAWPLTRVQQPAAQADDGSPTPPPDVVERLLCVPCARPAADRAAAMTDYRVLPPHQPPGRRVQNCPGDRPGRTGE